MIGGVEELTSVTIFCREVSASRTIVSGRIFESFDLEPFELGAC
jgi:hypothetical protein